MDTTTSQLCNSLTLLFFHSSFSLPSVHLLFPPPHPFLVFSPSLPHFSTLPSSPLLYPTLLSSPSLSSPHVLPTPPLHLTPRNVTAGAGSTNGLVLQDLVEKVVLLRRAVERERRQLKATSSPILSEKLRSVNAGM